jgi:hypothetical protein
MSTMLLTTLEGRVERLAAAAAALAQQVAAIGQTQWALAGQLAPVPPNISSPQRAVLTASLSAGSPGSPAAASGTLLVPDGSGGWTAAGGASITIYSGFATAITVSGPLFCWVWQDPADANYYLLVCDC